MLLDDFGKICVFKEKESGTVYRVTSHPDEKQAPKSASFTLKFFTAERAVLPT